MYLPPWLLSLTLLAPLVNAFYPYPEFNSEKGKTRARRFYPWTDTHGVGTDNPDIPTINIQKGGSSVSVVRYYSVDQALTKYSDGTSMHEPTTTPSWPEARLR